MGVSLDISRVEEELLLKEFKEKGLNPILLSVRNPLKIPEPILRDVLILVRNISALNSIYVAALVEGSGGVAINNLKSLILGHDKILSYATLSSCGIRIPSTIVALEGVDVDRIASSIEYPVIDKPPTGSWGRLVSIIKNQDALRQVFDHRSSIGSPQLRIHIIQKPATLGRDIRCFVINGEVIACMERRGVQGDWRSNAALGGEVIAYKPPDEVVELSIKASHAISVEIAGVDIIYDDTGYYVNEVNVVPEFKALMKATGVNVAGLIVEYVKRRLKT